MTGLLAQLAEQLTLNQRVVGSSPTGLTNHIWNLKDVQIPYMVYGQRFGRDFTESPAHLGAYLLSAHPHLPHRSAASTPLAYRRRVTRESTWSPHVVRIHSTCPLHACLIVKKRFAPRDSSGSSEPWRRLWHIDVCLSECTEDEYSPMGLAVSNDLVRLTKPSRKQPRKQNRSHGGGAMAKELLSDAL